MASRRMFSRSITGSGRFLRLSAQARALYYDLGMEADDEGFVEALVRLRATGAEEDHLRELERAGLILILDENDLVIHIQDWTVNNTLRRDRFTPSIYHALYPQCVEAAEPEPAGQPTDSQMTTTGQPAGVSLDVNPATQNRLGKDRIEKINIDQNISEKNRKEKPRSEQDSARTSPALPEDGFKTPQEEQLAYENKEKSIAFLLNSKHFGRNNPSVSPSAYG